MDKDIPKLEEIYDPEAGESPKRGSKKGRGKGSGEGSKGSKKGSGEDSRGSKKGSRSFSRGGKEIHHHYHMDEDGPYGFGPDGPPSSGDRHWRRSYREEDDGEVHIHYYYEPPRARRRRSSKPTIAAAFMLLTGVFALVGGAALTGLGSVPGDLADFIDIFTDDDRGDISGFITAPNGTPLENVKVSVVDEPISTETDADGFYVLRSIPVGNHELKYELEGYNTLLYKTFVDPSDYGRPMHSGWSDWDSSDKANDAHDFTLTEGDGTYEQGSYIPWHLVKGIMVSCGILLMVGAIVVFIGAYSAFKRKNFGLAIIGAVVGMVSMIGFIFGLIAIFILVLSRDEFKRRDEDRPDPYD